MFIYVHMLLRNPPGDRWLRDPPSFLDIRSPSTPPFSPPPPSPPACGTEAAPNRMRVSVKICLLHVMAYSPFMASAWWTLHICLKHLSRS